jgi:hypothetical protein
MFACCIEKHPASRSFAFTGFAFTDCSFYGDWFVVSTIVSQKWAIALNSHLLNSQSDRVELTTPALPQNASTFGKIDSSKIVCQDSPGKPPLGFAIYHRFQLKPQLKLQTSQFLKWYSSPKNTNLAVDGCNIGTRSGIHLARQLKSAFRQCLARFHEQSDSSKLFPHADRNADRNSDTIFGGSRRDRLFDNDTAILNCLQSGTDNILLSLYCGLVLHSIIEALLA